MNQLQYCEHEFLGSGGFSNVYKVSLIDKTYALKKIHPYLLKDPTVKTLILKEVHIMKQIDHPNIIKFYDCIENSHNELNLLLQYAEGGSLYNQLKIHQKLTQSQTVKYLKDIIKALKYLHSKPNPIMHRDIKPQNILLTKNGSCKLADFGSSNILDEQRNTFAGTKEYMAPQILESQPYGKQIDLWCLGVLIHELLIGTLPKSDDFLELPPSLSRPAEDVIKRLLKKDPSLRMTLDQLQNHIWLAQDQLQIGIHETNSENNNQLMVRKVQTRIQGIRKCINIERRASNVQKKEINFDQSTNTFQRHNQKQKLEKNYQDDISKRADEYLELCRLESELKIKLKKSKQQVLEVVDEFSKLRMLKLEEMYRLEEKIQEYQKNISLLERSYPLKFLYQYGNTARDFLRKTENLSHYVDYLPTKLIEETVQMPEIVHISSSRVPVDEYLIKLKNYMLQSQRDALIENIAAKKRQMFFHQLN